MRRYRYIGPIDSSTEELFDGTNIGLLLDVDLSVAPRGRQSTELAAALRRAVRSRRLLAGRRLPSTRGMAAALGVSRGTVVRTYEQLVAEGYLVARQGAGTVVAALDDEPNPAEVPVVRRSSHPGLPTGSGFPRRAWLRCATQAMAELADSDLGYGDPAGLAVLRAALNEYLARVRATSVDPQQMVIVNGFAQATRLIAEVLMAAGVTHIGVEDPGSSGVRAQFVRAGLTCVPIAVDREGIDVDVLAASGVRAVLVTPAHQFPTGVVLSPQRRRLLIEWAQHNDALIVEDDYDAELRYDRAPVGSLQGLAPTHVLYGGSVSKTLAPGLRLGWMLVPGEWFGPIVDAKYHTDLASGVIDQATLATFISSGTYERHLRSSAQRHRARRDALVSTIAARLTDWSVSGAHAGLHLVLSPPPQVRTRWEDPDELAAALSGSGLDVRSMRDYVIAAPPRHDLVVGYGHLRPDQIVEAVRALGEIERVGPG